MAALQDPKVRQCAAAMAACVAMTGCATSSRESGPASSAGVQGLFRAPSGMKGDLAPGPSAGWYVARQTPAYVKMGFAREHRERRGLGGWFARMFKDAGGAKSAEPRGVIADRAALPLPSIVTVTNVLTGATVKVRIEERAPMGEDLISLNTRTVRELGGESEPLLVRVRYAEPVIAYRQGAPLQYAAKRTRPKTQLASTADAERVPTAAENLISTARPAQPVATPAPAPTVAPVQQPSASKPTVMAKAEPAMTAVKLARPPARALRVQAGAFADPNNAKRAVAMLAPAGQARVEPTQRGGTTLYRVFLSAPREVGAAEALRAQVIRIGFKDAHIVDPL